MVLTEMDDIGWAILASVAGVCGILALAVYAEQHLLEGSPPIGGRPSAGRTTAPSAGRLASFTRSVGARGWSVTATLGFASLVFLLLVMSGVTLDMDEGSLPWFTALDHAAAGHWTARVLVMGGQLWLVGPLLLLAAARRARNVRDLAPLWVSAVALFGMLTLIWVMKLVAGRTAPHSWTNTVLAGGASFPSGHAAIAALCLPLGAALMILGARVEARRWPVVTAAAASLVVAACTIVLGYHWVSDAAGGLLVGWAFAVPAICLLRPPRIAQADRTGSAEAGHAVSEVRPQQEA